MNKWNSDEALLEFKKLLPSLNGYINLSESDTRSKLIDRVLIDCLGWEEIDIIREERCVESGTYLDYKLSTNIPFIIIEAKKESMDFELPSASNQRSYKIGGVLSKSKFLVDSMVQARDYSISKGISYCVVTNGKQYVFFRSQNQQGIDWNEHQAIVFRDLEEVEENFELFSKLLSKASVESGVLQTALTITGKTRASDKVFKTLSINHLAKPRKKDRNPLFPYLGEIIHKTFQDLASEEAESEILQHCYVDSPQKRDKGKPYLDIKSKPLVVQKREAGDFQDRILTSLKVGKNSHKEIILLLGSVGVGKSTFVQRFRKVLARKEIDESGIWIYLNFKHFSDTGKSLDEFVLSEIENTIQSEYSELGLDKWNLLKQVYQSEYDKLKEGSWAPLYKRSLEDFELKFGEKVDSLIESKKEEHLVRQLRLASKRFNKSIFLIFDNADQLAPDTQSKIFLAAEKLASKIDCYALLSMREESYWKTRDSGPLNAFHTTAYHVQPAAFNQVVSKRFKYARNLISSSEIKVNSQLEVSKKELLSVFDRLVATILSNDQRYIEFIESLSSRDTRRGLDTIAAFMISGHTNFDAILRDERKMRPGKFPIPFHEFLNSIILKDHESYNEEQCDIINIFASTGTRDASNFNRIAVLGRILSAKNEQSEIGTGYSSIESVVNDCHSVGIQPETSLSILSTFNSRRIIETETTIKDEISTSRYVRITSSGLYYITKLVKMFGYLDIVFPETPISDEKAFKKLNAIHTQLAKKGTNKFEDRFERVKLRLDLTEEFLNYLITEFSKCKFVSNKQLFSQEATSLLPDIVKEFSNEKLLVLSRAESVFVTKEKGKKRSR